MRCEDKWWMLSMSSHHLACTHPLCPSLAWEGIVNRPQCAHMPGKNCIFWQLLFTPWDKSCFSIRPRWQNVTFETHHSVRRIFKMFPTFSTQRLWLFCPASAYPSSTKALKALFLSANSHLGQLDRCKYANTQICDNATTGAATTQESHPHPHP